MVLAASFRRLSKALTEGAYKIRRIVTPRLDSNILDNNFVLLRNSLISPGAAVYLVNSACLSRNNHTTHETPIHATAAHTSVIGSE